MVDLSFKGFVIEPPSMFTSGCWSLRVELADGGAVACIPPRVSPRQVALELHRLAERIERLALDAVNGQVHPAQRIKEDMEARRLAMEARGPALGALDEAFPAELVQSDMEAMRLQWHARLATAEKRGAMPVQPDDEAR